MLARLLSIFRKYEPPKPFRWDECRRLYVVWGDPNTSDDYKEPNYITDPRNYDVELFEKPVTDEEFDQKYRHKVRAFLQPEDAIDFAYHCNLDGIFTSVYDLIDGKWVYNEDASERLTGQIN